MVCVPTVACVCADRGLCVLTVASVCADHGMCVLTMVCVLTVACVLTVVLGCWWVWVPLEAQLKPPQPR